MRFIETESTNFAIVIPKRSKLEETYITARHSQDPRN